MIKIEQVPAQAVWPVRHQAMYPDRDFAMVKLPDDATGLHLGLWAGGQLCSVISLFQSGNSLQFRKFATIPQQQGKGYGSRLLAYVIHYARQQGTSRIWCNARKTAAGFYQKFNFQETGETFFKNGIAYVRMELINREQ